MLQQILPPEDPCFECVTDGLRILVLDDSEFDLRRVSRLLSEIRSNVYVETTKTIEEFESAFRSSIYDICLIDYVLSGGKNGADALQIIKSSSIASKTPAVLITSLPDDDVLFNAIQSGFVSYIDKTCMTLAALKTVITEALDEVALNETTIADRFETVKQVKDDVALLYSRNTKEHLAKIYRNANFLRECIARREWPSPDAIDQIEASCFSVWRFLDEAEHQTFDLKRRPI